MSKVERVTREQLNDKQPGDEVALNKALPTEVKIFDEDNRELQFTISTGNVDRDGDTIDPAGWELDNYAKGGSVLWAHDPSIPPIAKPTKLWVEGNALKARAKFPDKETHEFGNLIYRLFKGGYLRATSVGFLPKEWAFNEERKSAGGFPAVDFKRQELLEFSAVPIPANPEALVEAGAKGIDCAPLISWAEANSVKALLPPEPKDESDSETHSVVVDGSGKSGDSTQPESPDPVATLRQSLSDLGEVSLLVLDRYEDLAPEVRRNLETASDALIKALEAVDNPPSEEPDLEGFVDKALADDRKKSINLDKIVDDCVNRGVEKFRTDLARAKGALI